MVSSDMMTNQSECESSCSGNSGKIQRGFRSCAKEEKGQGKAVFSFSPGLEQLSSVSEWECFF